MKIAYTSVFLDGTGYSNAAQDTCLCLDAAGLDVVAIPVKLATQYVEPASRIKELMSKSRDGVDVCIQHILAPYFVYRSGMKNIGYVHFETDFFGPSGWLHYCNLMDEIWVSCELNKQAALKSGVKVPIKVVPIPCDPKKYALSEARHDLGKHQYKYKFYHVGDYSTRKNTANLIKSYLEEFSKADNVVLILKCYVEACSPEESVRIIKEDILKIKESLRKYSVDAYPPIILLPEYLSPEAVQGLHRSCDCFVTLERGSAWTLPAFDAIGHGKWIIANGYGGHTHYLRDGVNSDLLPYKMIPVQGMNRCPYPTLYTCHEKWADPDLRVFKHKMREAYDKNKSQLRGYDQMLIKEYSYDSKGKFFKELLNA